MKRIRAGRFGLLPAAAAAVAAFGAPSASATEPGALAWGANEEAQLGNGTNVNSSTAVAVASLSGVVSVAVSGDHGLALKSNGTVWAWGDNSKGELGDGTTGNRKTPVAVSGLSEVKAIAAAPGFSMALLNSGHVKVWGANTSGQLADGLSEGPEECGDGFLKKEGCAKTPVAVEGLSEVTAIAAGGLDALALLSNGHVDAWGSNAAGQLGTGTFTGPSECEVNFAFEACSRTAVASEEHEATAISAGGRHELALLTGGGVAAWGANGDGQLGIGNATGPSSCPAATIGASEACSPSPVAVKELSGATSVAAGGAHSLALLSTGTVVAWGANGAGQLGTGSFTGPAKCGSEQCSTAAVTVSELSGAGAIAAGAEHSLALVSGNVRAWGGNGKGQLGDGTTANRDLPVASLTEAEGISAGGGTSLAFGAPGPAVSKLEPASGPQTGGTSVKVTGTGFTGATAVTFGTAAASFVVNSSTSITATAPAGKLGARAVTVSTSRATSASTAKFTYEPEGTVELGRCEKVAAGKGSYKDGACTEGLSGGSFEWFAPVKKGFTAKAPEGTITFETTGEETLLCKGSTLSGEYKATKQLVNVSMKLTSCEQAGVKCTTAGAAEGELVSGTLEGVLGWAEKETNKVGLALFPASEGEAMFLASCGATTVRVRGAVVGVISPNNKMSTTFTLKLKQKKGKQTFERLEGEGSPQVLEKSVGGGFFIQTGLALEATITNEESLEINTII